MKILITSGGTKIPIDLVRSITNMSRGTFGSKICDAFWTSKKLDINDRVVFFYAKDSRMPSVFGKTQFFQNMEFIEYKTFDDYRTKLVELVKREAFDLIVLAAAVSDYGVEKVYNGKYRSTSDDMVIKLVKLPKVIDEVKAVVQPSTTICGFKLLVNSTDAELRDAMDKQLVGHGIDLVVGNDLRDIYANNHRLTIKSRFSDEYAVHTKQNGDLAQAVVAACFDTMDMKAKQ